MALSVANSYYIVLAILGIILPIAISIVYVLVKKEKMTTVLIGAATFLVFAIILESIPKVFLLSANNPVGLAILSNPLLTGLVAACLAGLFEETGRFVAFKFCLKKRSQNSTAIACGLGHGLFEVIFVVGFTSIQCLTYIAMINSGSFDLIVAQVAATAPDQAAALAALPETFSAVTFATLPLAIMERVGAVLFHTGASCVVFTAVRGNKKGYLYPVAILLHFTLDSLAALAGNGVITNLWVFEIITCIYGLAVLVFGLILLKKLKNN